MKFSIAAALSIIPLAFAADTSPDKAGSPVLPPSIEERQATTQLKLTLFANGGKGTYIEYPLVDGYWHGLSENLNHLTFYQMDVQGINPRINPPDWHLMKCASRYRENGQVIRSEFAAFSHLLQFEKDVPIHGLCCYYDGFTGAVGLGNCD